MSFTLKFSPLPQLFHTWHLPAITNTTTPIMRILFSMLQTGLHAIFTVIIHWRRTSKNKPPFLFQLLVAVSVESLMKLDFPCLGTLALLRTTGNKKVLRKLCLGMICDSFSFDYGNIHLVMLNTETDFTINSPQYNWLAQDLSSVNRALTPWLIVTGHRYENGSWIPSWWTHFFLFIFL